MAKKAIFVMLLIWTTQLCAEGASQTEPNTSKPTHNLQENLGSKVKDKPIDKGSDEPEKGTGGILKNDTEDTCITKAWRLQYTQLLEIHRSYFTVFIRVLSVYLAIMGACFKIVSDNIEKFKNPKGKDGSKTVLIVLILFSFVVSGLFYKGLKYGETDAIERNKQIADIEENLQIVDVAGKPKIKHIGTELLPQVIFPMIIVTGLIIIGWIAMLVRGLMACTKKETLRDFISYLKEWVLQRFKQCTKQ